MSLLQNETTIKVAIMSDLHAYDLLRKDKTVPSFLCCGPNANSNGPIDSLIDLITKESLSANIVLCPGDLGDKARKSGVKFGWKCVHNVAAALKSETIIGTVGNHDIDSRHSDGDDPTQFGHLQRLDPRFPVVDPTLCNQYWAQQFAFLDYLNITILNVNSSAHHGFHRGQETHGLITDDALALIKQGLISRASKQLKIVLCHHHPHKHSELDLGEYDEIVGGQRFLKLLEEYPEWLVIHGHKHHPKLTYANGSSSSPVVFSAGSLSASLYETLRTKVRNQFYILEFPINVYSTMGFVGQYSAWDWHVGIGWVPATLVGSGLPATGGFGVRGKARIVANDIATFVSNGVRSWTEILAQLPILAYFIPDDLERVVSELTTTHSLTVERDSSGTIAQIGKRQ
jgi:hypothetical protein